MFLTIGIFLIVPNLNFDVYLGQSFIRSDKFICFSLERFYMSPSGRDGRRMIRAALAESCNVLQGDITYLTRYTYSNSLEELQSNPPEVDAVPLVKSTARGNTFSTGDRGESCGMKENLLPAGVGQDKMEKETTRRL